MTDAIVKVSLQRCERRFNLRPMTSRTPAFGMNSIFVGGDSKHGGNYVTSRNPWTGSAGEVLAATRMSEVKNPSKLIVSSPAR